MLAAAAYESLINFTTAPNLAEEFLEIPNVPMKNIGLATVYMGATAKF